MSSVLVASSIFLACSAGYFLSQVRISYKSEQAIVDLRRQLSKRNWSQWKAFNKYKLLCDTYFSGNSGACYSEITSVTQYTNYLRLKRRLDKISTLYDKHCTGSTQF
jgi:hypothetical protein